MKTFSLLFIFGISLFLLPVAGKATHNVHMPGKATHNAHMPTVLIIKEDLERKDDYKKTIKREAYNNVMKIFESEYDDIRFVSKVIDSYDRNDTNKTKINLNQFIQENKKNLVYIVFLPNATSTYNQIKNYLPEKIPIITSIGTVKSLDKTNIWVTTISSLAKGKANAIEKLMQIEKKDELIALYDKKYGIGTYTNEILDNLKKNGNVSVSRIPYIKGSKIKEIESINKLQEENKLILLFSKSSNKTIDIFNNFKQYISPDINQENDILLLKIKKEERKDVNLTKSKIFELTYTIPGYNPDLRLPLYQEVEGICDNLKKIDKHMCLTLYGYEYIKLHTYLNLALSPPRCKFK